MRSIIFVVMFLGLFGCSVKQEPLPMKGVDPQFACYKKSGKLARIHSKESCEKKGWIWKIKTSAIRA